MQAADSIPSATDSLKQASPAAGDLPYDSSDYSLLRSISDSSGGQARILYYGDSQIEGDRITSYLREFLRREAGGTGPGLFLPLMPVMYTKTAWIRSSSNWARYNYLSYRTGEISHRMLGPFMTICRYLPEGVVSDAPVKAWVEIRPSRMADSASAIYDQLRIFYRNAEGPVDIRVLADNNVLYNFTLTRGDSINEYSCSLDNPAALRIEFSGNVSPDIYGISIEGNEGVVVDNMPQRGSAGLEFTMVERSNLEAMFSLLSPDLIILQYGLNIVRNVKEDYTYYSKGLSRQLALLKEVSPGTPVIVVGLTDMASTEGDSIRSFRNIPAIIEAQRKAASEQDVIFWNAWEAMGGETSIIRWAAREPPLAQKDYVHLTYTGADTLSGILIRSLFTPVQPIVADSVSNIIDTTGGIEPGPADAGSKTPAFGLLATVLAYDMGKPMIFTSPVFWLFFLVVLGGYSLVYRKLSLRNIYLLLVSLFFYYKSGGLFVILLVFVTAMDFMCGLAIGGSKKKPVRKLFVLISIFSNLGILAYFKYTGFIVESINSLFGTGFVASDFFARISNIFLGSHFNIDDIILPVGISFFTFQSLSYTFDVYRSKIEPVRNILDFGFYVSFFPQLVAGPIVRASEFIPQLYTRYHLDMREFSHALFLISKGLVKKIIISDFIAVGFIDRVFEAPAIYSGFENLMAVYGYGLQIYCDFSGYTDIAIGLGLIFGFRLPVNFNSPYKAAGLQDFWRRWHISLSRWLRDYLYIPLGGNRKGKIRGSLNLLITMLLGGLWHGADMRFVIWGFLHGIGLVLEKIWKQITGGRSLAGRLLTIFLTFQFVSFCWIFFRAPHIENVRIMLLQITGSFSPGNWTAVLMTYSKVFFVIALGYLLHLIPENIKEATRGIFIRIPLSVQLAAIMFIAVLLYSMRTVDTIPFIYFRF